MTPLQFPKKPDFSSAAHQRKQLEITANHLIWKINLLQNERDEIDDQIEVLERKHSDIEQQLKSAGVG